MDKYRKIITRMKLQTFPLLGAVAMFAIFGTFWGATAWAVTEGFERIFALVPLPMFAIVFSAFMYQLRAYLRAINALKYGFETTAIVLSVNRTHTSNSAGVYSIKVRYTNSRGQEVVAKTMNCYYSGEARELEQRGTVSIKYFGKGIFITEVIETDYSPLAEMKRNLELASREGSRDYKPRERDDSAEAVFGVDTSDSVGADSDSVGLVDESDKVFGFETSGSSGSVESDSANSSASGEAVSHVDSVTPKDEELRRLADLGVPYASDLLALNGYERLRFCALYSVGGEVRSALEQDMSSMTNDEHLLACMDWYRGLRRDIETGSLEDSIVLVDFFDYYLESEETLHAIELVLEKSKDVEPYMLASRTVRRLKQYRRVIEVCAEISDCKDVNRIISIIAENRDDIGNLLAFVGATARGSVSTSAEKARISAALEEMGGE